MGVVTPVVEAELLVSAFGATPILCHNWGLYPIPFLLLIICSQSSQLELHLFPFLGLFKTLILICNITLSYPPAYL